jgi:hypothetical protein
MLAPTCLISLVLIAFLVPSNIQARTWIVARDGSDDFTRVQLGIDAAESGDSVLVVPGTYVENIRFRGRDIVLRSTQGPSMTILDGRLENRSVVEFLSGESNACVIEGFTITGGRGSSIVAGEKIGGGIMVQDAEPSIIGNVIQGNRAFATPTLGAGGGIFCRAGHPDNSAPLRIPRILTNVIRDNAAGGNAGGIGLQSKISAIIIGNEILGNTTADGDGGGVWILARQTTEIVIERNQISSNIAMDHGGGILASNSFHGITPPLPMRIVGNVIWDNMAKGAAQTGESGGGIVLACVGGLVASNTIVHNHGEGAGNGYGGGILLTSPSSPVLERNVIAINAQGGGVLCRNGVTPILQNNIVWGNDGGDALGTCTEWLTVNGNIIADPLFCGAADGDFSLPPDSPAFTHPAGPLGALTLPGCKSGVTVQATTWGRIKALWLRDQP